LETAGWWRREADAIRLTGWHWAVDIAFVFAQDGWGSALGICRERKFSLRRLRNWLCFLIGGLPNIESLCSRPKRRSSLEPLAALCLEVYDEKEVARGRRFVIF